MVLMPPGSAKSTYCSVLFPAWFLGFTSGANVIGASHASDLAEDFSGRVQAQIKHHPDILGYGLASENVKLWRTTNGGVYRAAGVGGSITGRRSDLTIIDDPVRGAADAESETIRNTTWEWYQSEVYTRQKPGARIILVMTRWHPDDLGGRLLSAANAGGDKWTILRLPALADAADDPLGRAPGDVLWPEWEDATAIQRKRANIGEHAFGALYQQDPRPRGAAFFDVAHLLEDGAPVEMPDRCDTVLATIDTAVKTGKTNDGTGVVFWSYNSLTKAPTLILDWEIKQIEGDLLEQWLPTVFERLEQYARLCGARYGSAGVLIEDKATGMVLLQRAKRLGQKARAIDSKLTAMGKDERAIAASSYVTRGDIKITEPAHRKLDIYKGQSGNHLLMQISGFRLGAADGAADDLLDCFCYGVAVTRGWGSGPGKGM